MPRSKSITAAESETLSRLIIVRGVVTLLFGILALVWPGLTLVTFGILLSLWFLVSGITGIITSISSRSSGNWVFRLLVAVLQLGIGAYLVQRPGLSVATIVALIAIGLLVEGVVDVVAAFMKDAPKGGGRWLRVIGGVLGVVAGIIIWRYPVTGSLAFVWVLGLYALITGSFMIALGLSVDD